jgi:hypothetical protein
MIIDNKYSIGDIVYLKTDKEQLERMVTGVCQKPLSVIYEIASGTSTNWAYEVEMSIEKNILIATTN